MGERFQGRACKVQPLKSFVFAFSRSWTSLNKEATVRPNGTFVVA
jgi:hypothetical protein